MRLHRWMLALVSWLVPKDARADWRAEWEAELRHRETVAAARRLARPGGRRYLRDTRPPMKRAPLVALLVATALWLVHVHAATDALSDVRAALGGDAVLSQITSIHATGKIVQYSGTRDGAIEIYYRNPDRFVRVTRTGVNAAGAYSGTTDRNGRSIDRRLLEDRSFEYGSLSMPDLVTDMTVTTNKTGFRGTTPITNGRSGGGTLGSARQYAAFAIPLLAQLTSSYPAKVTASSDAITFDGDDGVTWILALDQSTRLPATLTRSASPATDTVITFSDYTKVGGVVWPFHVVTRTGDRLFDDVTIKKYEINKPIADNVFR